MIDVQISSMSSDRQVNVLRKVLEKELSPDDETLNEYAKVKILQSLEEIEKAAIEDTKVAKTIERRYCGLDRENLFGGVDFYDGMMYATGDAFKYNTTTSDDLPDDVIERYSEMFSFISENIQDIEELIHQFSTKGGIKPNTTYSCVDNEGLWKIETSS